MDVLDLARLQFASTTLFHYIFVPLSIGLALWVAICQTMAYRTRDDSWEQAARFWGKLFLVSFALGVATGIVQEFQFGMNWSSYSRYVGDVFGAPLAMEALVAFFLESTFLGLWIFGRGRLSPKLHLTTIWMVAIGSMLSAFFILAANSWMQHPVGFEMNAVTGRAEMTSIWAVLTNTTALYAIPHTIFAAWTTAAMVVVAVSAWHLHKGTHAVIMGKTLRIGLAVTLGATLATATVGHFQGQHLVDEQPMKMAAAEALFETREPAPFSLFATGDWTPNPGRTNVDIQVPRMLSFLAQGNFDAKVLGINELNARYRQQYGPGDYTPIVGLTYWSFRAMIGIATAMMALAAFLLFKTRRGAWALGPRTLKLLVPAAMLPFAANFAGWIFTEMGRQPWVVQGLLKTEDAVSPSASAFEVGSSLVGFTLLYAVLGVIGYRLFARLARQGFDPLEPETPPPGAPKPASDLVLSY